NEQAMLLQQAILTQAPPEQVDAILLRIDVIDTDLTAAGTHFGMALAQAARLLDRWLMGGIVGIATLLTVVSVLQIRKVLIKQARDEYTMAQAHRRWELASAAAGLGLYEMDQATGTLRLDSKSAEMHGLGHAPLVLPRSALRDLVIREVGDPSQQDIDAALQPGADHKIIYRVKHPDGTIRALESTGRMVQPQDGGATCLIGVLRDVTKELSQADMALKRASAERVAQSQREFLSRLSHELRTPLNAILGFAQLLDMDQRQPLAQVQRQQVQWILSAGQQLLRLVEDVLDLSKVEAGEITMRLQTVDVHQAIQDCLHLVEGARLQHQIDILDQTEETPRLHVMADPQRLRQILVNLLSNACKYNHPGGHVTIEMHQDNDEVVININDSGLGMTADDAADLFQPFKRAHATMAYAEGTGLGLYIVKQLVERMNGSVSVASQPGVGSRFTVTLPAASDPL
ncbi:MAG: PAS domain-containing sensor histidine kinase, partial [Pseudomonadota bacterium]